MTLLGKGTEVINITLSKQFLTLHYGTKAVTKNKNNQRIS